MVKETKEKIENFSSLIAAIIALVALIRQVVADYGDLAASVAKNWQLYVIPTVILLFLALWRRDRLQSWLAPSSVVRDREAFHIGRKYLLGRENDIDNLVDAIQEWPLVFLVGESGAGKSSLLDRGVLPRLRETPGLFPLYIDTWGSDWIEGPREALSRAINSSPSDTIRSRLGLTTSVPTSEAFTLLERLRHEDGLLPVLLLDQFDDYQTRHRARFVDGPQKTLLGAADLVDKNPFWKDIAALLASNSLHVLITIRSDAKAGLESIRLTEPKVYLLDPLEKGVAANLLNTISKNAIENPERGFDRLENRLLNDLAPDGWVLPIQMQTAFRGLAELPRLSTGEYERQGGLTGIEALYLERQILAASRAIEQSDAEIRSLLLAMVDHTTRKTVPKSIDQLLGSLPTEAGDRGRLLEVLGKLQNAEVVREKIDPGREETVWQLDHDYLSRGLLELDRRGRRWSLLIEEAARAFEGARGFAERWRKLLPPSTQLRLLYERLRGRVRYGSQATYATLSSLRFIFSPWLLAALLAAWAWRDLNIQREAIRLFAAFGEEEMTRIELRALWELSSASLDVRRAFFETALATENAGDFAHRSEEAVRSAIGLDKEARDSIARPIFLSNCWRPDSETLDAVTATSCTHLALATGNLEQQWSQRLLTEMRRTEDIKAISELAEGLGSLRSELKAKDASEATQLLVTAAKADPRSSFHLMKSFDLLFPALQSQHAADTWSSLLSSPLGTDILFPNTLEPLARKLTGPVAAKAWEDLISASERDSTLDGREYLTFDILAQRLPSDRALEIWIPTLALADLSAAPYPTKQILISLEKAFSPADALTAARLLLAKASREKSSYALSNLDQMLATLPLNQTDAQGLASSVVELAAAKLGPSSETLLPRSLGSFGRHLEAGKQRDLVVRILLTQPLRHEQLTALALLSDSLSPEEAKATYTAAIDSLFTSASSSSPGNGFFDGLLRISRKLDRKDAIAISHLIHTKLESTPPTASRRSLWMLLAALGANLPTEVAIEVAEALLPFGATRESDVIQTLFTSLPDEHAEHVLQRLLTFIQGERKPNCAAAIPLLRQTTLLSGVNLLKWPTCSREDRARVIERIDEITGLSFGSRDTAGTFHPDLWKLADWAESQGYEPARPPASLPLKKLE